MSYDATILDCDGVIVEPPAPETLAGAASATLDRVNVDADPRTVARELFAGEIDALAERCRRSGVEFTSFCQQAASASFAAQRRELQDGVRSAYDDVRTLRELDGPLGLVSDNHQQVVEYVLRRFGLSELFESVRCRSVTPRCLERGKPDARNLSAALADLSADSAVYVGDTAADVEAAHRAGVDGVLVARADDEPDGRADADYVIDGLQELSAVVE